MINSLYKVFQHWSSKGSVYIISDTHFNDSDCKLMDPNWVTPDEQVEILRRYIHKNDTLIHLGDVGDPSYISRIPGYHVLIMGNHDQSATKFQQHFDEIYEGPLMISEKIILSHEPISGCNWCMNIHGHDHNPENVDGLNHLNLAANVCNYTPVSLGALIKSGLISKIDSIHRITIDQATDRKRNIYE